MSCVYSDLIAKLLTPIAKKQVYAFTKLSPRCITVSTAHEALSCVLDPPNDYFGQPEILDSDDYKNLRRDALAEMEAISNNEPPMNLPKYVKVMNSKKGNIINKGIRIHASTRLAEDILNILKDPSTGRGLTGAELIQKLEVSMSISGGKYESQTQAISKAIKYLRTQGHNIGRGPYRILNQPKSPNK